MVVEHSVHLYLEYSCKINNFSCYAPHLIHEMEVSKVWRPLRFPGPDEFVILRVFRGGVGNVKEGLEGNIDTKLTNPTLYITPPIGLPSRAMPTITVTYWDVLGKREVHLGQALRVLLSGVKRVDPHGQPVHLIVPSQDTGLRMEVQWAVSGCQLTSSLMPASSSLGIVMGPS